MTFDTAAMIWLTAGIGIGLFLAMAGFGVLSVIERVRLGRRVRAARGRAKLNQMTVVPTAVAAPPKPAARVEVAAPIADEPAMTPTIPESGPSITVMAEVAAAPLPPEEPTEGPAERPVEVAVQAPSVMSAPVPTNPPVLQQPPPGRVSVGNVPAAPATPAWVVSPEVAVAVSAPSSINATPPVPEPSPEPAAAPAAPPLHDIVVEPPRPAKPKRPQTEKEKVIAAAAARRRVAMREKAEADRKAAELAAREAELRAVAEQKAALARAEAERRAAERAAIEAEQQRREREREAAEAEAIARRKAAAERVAQKEAAKKAAAEKRMEELAAALRAQEEAEARAGGTEVSALPVTAEPDVLPEPKVPPPPVLVDKDEERRKIAQRAAELRAEGARREASRKAATAPRNPAPVSDPVAGDAPREPRPNVDVEDLFARAFSASVRPPSDGDSSGKI